MTDMNSMLEGLARRDRRTMGRAVTIIEDDLPGKEQLLNYAYRNSACDGLVIGITGAGGAGKSTLIDRLIFEYRAQGKTVGVLAVDPSSPYSGGAVLGDRVRMSYHSADKDVFIRSLGSRGAAGGISQGAKEVLYLYKSFGFDVIILESLGVGQAETDISNYVDVTALVMVPGYGDAIQMAKAGVLEMSDIFVINKADRPETDLLVEQLRNAFSSMQLSGLVREPKILKTVACVGKGVAQLVEALDETARENMFLRPQKETVRIQCEIVSKVLSTLEEPISRCAGEMLDSVLSGSYTPFEAAIIIRESIVIKK